MATLGNFDVILPSEVWKQERQVITILQRETAPEDFDGVLMLRYNDEFESRFFFAFDGDTYELSVDISDYIRSSDTGVISLELNTGATLDFNYNVVGLIKPEYIPAYPVDVTALLTAITPSAGVNNIILPPQRQIDIE